MSEQNVEIVRRVWEIRSSEVLNEAVLEYFTEEYLERAATPKDYRELFKETFGPAVAIYASLADQPDRAQAFDRDFLEVATQANRGEAKGPAEFHYEYLLVVARKRGV